MIEGEYGATINAASVRHGSLEANGHSANASPHDDEKMIPREDPLGSCQRPEPGRSVPRILATKASQDEPCLVAKG